MHFYPVSSDHEKATVTLSCGRIRIWIRTLFKVSGRLLMWICSLFEATKILMTIILYSISQIHLFSLLCRLHVIYPASEEEGFDFHYQAKMQLAGLAVTLALSIVGGLFTGAILKIPFFDKTRTQSLFDDEDYWIVSESKTKYFYRKAFQFCL